MLIAQISDTHIALNTPDADRRIADFAATVQDINSLDPLPDVVVHSGDIVHNGLAEEYTETARILSLLKIPYFVMVGNKDDRQQVRSAFPDHSYLRSDNPFIHYRIDDFPVSMIMLDTVMDGSNKGELCHERQSALEQLAAANSDKPTIVFMHHPPFAARECPDPHHFKSKENALETQAALKSVPNLKAILCGHVHRFDAGQVGDIPTIAMPCIATSLRWGNYSENFSANPVYLLHESRPDGSLVTRSRIVIAGR